MDLLKEIFGLCDCGAMGDPTCPSGSDSGADHHSVPNRQKTGEDHEDAQYTKF